MKSLLVILLFSCIVNSISQHIFVFTINSKTTKSSHLSFKWLYIDEQNGDSIVKLIDNPQVNFLSFVENSFTKAGGNKLAEVLKNDHVVSLNFRRNILSDDDSFDAIFGNLKYTAIAHLDLGFNQMGDERTEKLAGFLRGTKIATLNLVHNKIRPNGAKSISNALKGSQITALGLGLNYLEDLGVEYLAEGLSQSKIRELDLQWNLIGDLGAAAIARVLKNTKIRILNLWGNFIGDEGAVNIAASLPGSLIGRLYLGRNLIGDVGARALLRAVKNSLIYNLNLAGNNISRGILEELNKAVEANRLKLNNEIRLQQRKNNTEVVATVAKTDGNSRYVVYGLSGLIVACIVLLLIVICVLNKRTKSLKRSGSISKKPLVA